MSNTQAGKEHLGYVIQDGDRYYVDALGCWIDLDRVSWWYNDWWGLQQALTTAARLLGQARPTIRVMKLMTEGVSVKEVIYQTAGPCVLVRIGTEPTYVCAETGTDVVHTASISEAFVFANEDSAYKSLEYLSKDKRAAPIGEYRVRGVITKTKTVRTVEPL